MTISPRPVLAAALGISLLSLPVQAPAAPAAPQPAAGQCKLKTASGLGYTILTQGKGAAPVDSDKVNIKYRGTLAADGKEFDKSDSATFGVTEVIPGFTEGLKLMRVGGRARICIPAALGYGAAGTGPIPANADLVFEIDLLSIKQPTGPLPAAERSCSLKTASGLGYTVVKPGTGASPTGGDVALINYKGFLAATGALFDEADAAPLPIEGVISGFAEGLKLTQRGGSYKLCIPAALGYGEKEIGPIPASSNLVFLIDMIDFRSMAEIQGSQPQQ